MNGEVMQGRIVRFYEDRRFGFIKPTSGEPDVFVHISALPGGEPPPHQRALVRFDLETTPKGPKAVNISYVQEMQRSDPPARYGDALTGSN